MASANRREVKHMSKFTLLSTAAVALAATMPAAAQVRTEANPAALVNPTDTAETQTMFERSGMFMIAGGVVPGGHAAFFAGNQLVPASDVQPIALANGAVALRVAGADYRVAMPAGLACPLGEFTARDGVVAYTVPKYMDPHSRIEMLDSGLAHHRIAREFDNTPFAPLLKAADFGATVPLPPAEADQITGGINSANGISGIVLTAADDLDTMIGSYINSGMQVTYHVYLMPAAHSAEIGGVPLRYFWKLDQSGAAGIFSVEMYAQNWAPGTQLSQPGAAPTQYDVVNFYQVAALFRQLHETNPAAFTTFVDRACNKAI
jgi:hypothetical protein